MSLDRRFESAVEHVFKHEGGFINHPHDAGGATNYGISLRFLRGIRPGATIDDIRRLTRKEAAGIYHDHFWIKARAHEMHRPVGEKIFDIAVNAGIPRAHRILQEALNSLGAKLSVDGIAGPITLRSLSAFSPQDVVNACCDKQEQFYRGIVSRNPSQLVFLKGWLRRSKYLRA